MKKSVNGYMTVEISMLFPIIFITLCMLFYMCFCFHDIVVSRAFLYRFGTYSYYQDMTEKECEKELKKGLNERLVISKPVMVQFSGTKAKADFKINFIGGIWKNKKFQLQIKIENRDKTGTLRKYRALKELVE